MVLVFGGSRCRNVRSLFKLSVVDELLDNCVSKSLCLWYLLTCSRWQFFTFMIITTLCMYKPKILFVVLFLSHRYIGIGCIICRFQPLIFFYSVYMAFRFFLTGLFKLTSVRSLANNALTPLWGFYEFIIPAAFVLLSLSPQFHTLWYFTTAVWPIFYIIWNMRSSIDDSRSGHFGEKWFFPCRESNHDC
jgi:hypothetical protein